MNDGKKCDGTLVNATTSICDCNDGYMGDKCNECKSGYFDSNHGNDTALLTCMGKVAFYVTCGSKCLGDNNLNNFMFL